MVKMSTRVWSFVLVVVMLVSSLSCVAFAQYDADAVLNAEAYYSDIQYDFLVGPGNEEPGVYIINASWGNYKGDEVTFTFRDKTVTETYNPERHFGTFADATKYVKEHTIKEPIYIFTAGVYAFSMTTRQSVTILGPKAGMDPNVRDADPTKEWALASNRFLPAADATETNGEAVFRPNSTDKMMKIDNDGKQDADLVIDGIVLQGDGAGAGDETYRNGGSLHRIYVQNCILDDAHASGGRGAGAAFGFDMRNAQEHEKHLYLSNLYIVNQNSNSLYSGHANVVKMNGCSYQRSTKQPFNTVNCIQWQGQVTEITNSHFWNPTGVTVSNGAGDGKFLNAPLTNWCSNTKGGNDEILFSISVKNNSFNNVGATGQPMFYMGMAGNSTYTIEDNIFIDTENHASHTIFKIDYVTVNGVVTRVGIGGGQFDANGKDTSGVLVNEGNYLLNNDNVSIQNNTFIGSEYQNIVDIGKNKNKNTDVQQRGNLYLDSLSSTEGKIIEPSTAGANAYNQWVWLDAAMTQKSSEIREEDVVFQYDGSDIARVGYDLTLDVGPKDYEIDITATAGAGNGVRVYSSNAEWEKKSKVGEDRGTYGLKTPERVNYFVISITSVDGRTERDYKLIVNRAANPDAQLLDILPEPGVLMESIDRVGSVFTVQLNYYQENFPFKLSMSSGAKAVVTKGFDMIFANNGVYTAENLKSNEAAECKIKVTDADGKAETYTLIIVRKANTETAVESMACNDASKLDVLGNNTFYMELNAGILNTTVRLELSPEATATIREPIYQSLISGTNGSFKITNIPGGQNTYTVQVLAQDGIHYETWYIVINRKARTECELKSIAGTEKIGNVYYAFTANKNYMVSASCSAGAHYTVYSDANCTKAFDSTYIPLSDVTTTVWLRVVAEDGLHKSAPIKLVISSYADFGQTENNIVKLDPVTDPYHGAITIDGATFDAKNPGNPEEPVNVVIALNIKTESFEFQARPYNGYDIRLMSDNTDKPMRPDETKGDNVAQITIKPDAGYTWLYATASKTVNGKDVVIPYTILILCPKKYTYTDTQTDWAKGYVNDIATNGFGLMKGDEKGAFNGEQLFTRYEMAALMVRMAGANAALYSPAKNPFSDVADSHWAASYVKAAYRLELIKGYETLDENDKVIDTTYQGDKNATRNEFFRVYANTYLGDDVDNVYKAQKEAIDTYVDALELKDLDKVADWAKPAVYFVIYKQWVIGDEKKNVNPETNITRNEVATVLSRNWKEFTFPY